MSNQYKNLPFSSISPGAKVNRRTLNRAINVSLSDSAKIVMTDFNEVSPYSIEHTATIIATNDRMIAFGVRMLFVTNSEGELAGIITSTDVLGEKPVKYIREHGGKRDDILAQDVMTAKEKLDVLSLSDVDNASVGDIVETMKHLGRQHTLVVDANSEGIETIQGMFSTAQIGRQLGIEIEQSNRAHSFADIERALMSA